MAAGHGLAGREESCRPNETIIAYWYSLSMIILSVLFTARWRASAGASGCKVGNLEKGECRKKAEKGGLPVKKWRVVSLSNACPTCGARPCHPP
jgi:hypothetical protein